MKDKKIGIHILEVVGARTWVASGGDDKSELFSDFFIFFSDAGDELDEFRVVDLKSCCTDIDAKGTVSIFNDVKDVRLHFFDRVNISEVGVRDDAESTGVANGCTEFCSVKGSHCSLDNGVFAAEHFCEFGFNHGIHHSRRNMFGGESFLFIGGRSDLSVRFVADSLLIVKLIVQLSVFSLDQFGQNGIEC